MPPGDDPAEGTAGSVTITTQRIVALLIASAASDSGGIGWHARARIACGAISLHGG